METETGTVVEVADGKAVVRVEGGDHCATCAARGTCIALGSERRHISAANHIGAKVGDRVRIECSPQWRVLSAFLLFFFPVVLALIGYVAGFSVRQTEGSGVIGTFVGLIAALAIIRLASPALAKSRRRPTIRGIRQ